VFEHGGYAGLLEHDLGDPDAIRIAGSPPGKIATIAIVPMQESALKISQSGIAKDPAWRIWIHGEGAL